MNGNNIKKRAYNKLDFTQDEEEKIISFVKINPELYDPKNSNFKNKIHKEKLWNDLAITMDKTGRFQLRALINYDSFK